MEDWNNGKTRRPPFDKAQGRETAYKRQKKVKDKNHRKVDPP
jgi:hypothetical protein